MLHQDHLVFHAKTKIVRNALVQHTSVKNVKHHSNYLTINVSIHALLDSMIKMENAIHVTRDVNFAQALKIVQNVNQNSTYQMDNA
jgi:hypothetical protein